MGVLIDAGWCGPAFLVGVVVGLWLPVKDRGAR